MQYFDESKRQRFQDALSSTVAIFHRSNKVYRMYGTGIVLSPDGVILTAWHVLNRARVVRVSRMVLTKKGWQVRRYGKCVADVVYRDRKADIALIKLRKPSLHLTVATLGDSDTLYVGSPVFRVGNDFSGRRLAEGHAYSFFARLEGLPRIFSSMSVEAGGSGGPLFDMHGNVVGVVLTSAADASEPEHCGALPINYVKKRLFWRKDVKELFAYGVPI